tara:strand:+ start:606 stop:950 length:345 start_codon:yes stop_codon:yes gene_type:complete
MGEITMDQLRARIATHIRQNFKTQRAFARDQGCSDAYVSAVLLGVSGVPLAWAELVGAKIEVRVTVEDWARRIEPQSNRPVYGTKCLACGKHHYGIAGLPCPTMTPVARGGEHG